MDLSRLPTANATLNAIAAGLIVAGWFQIRRRNVEAHRRCMIAACGASAIFLILYVIYHAQVGSVPYRGGGWLRPVYFFILITHVVLAAAIVPLVLVTLRRALVRRYDDHRRIARFTLPIWLYVSVTGVIVYAMLYHGPG